MFFTYLSHPALPPTKRAHRLHAARAISLVLLYQCAAQTCNAQLAPVPPPPNIEALMARPAAQSTANAKPAASAASAPGTWPTHTAPSTQTVAPTAAQSAPLPPAQTEVQHKAAASETVAPQATATATATATALPAPAPTATAQAGAAATAVATAVSPAVAPPSNAAPALPGAPPETRSATDLAAKPPPPANTSGQSPQAVEATVHAWAAAWSKKDVNTYLGFYAPQFVPPNKQQRGQWERERRTRILKNSAIQVWVDQLEVRVAGPHAVARFRQEYRAPTLAVSSAKELRFSYASGHWRIIKETVIP